MYEALAYCKQLKDLGYKVFAQVVSVTTYTDEKLKEYAELVNSVMLYANSMVDTYGLLDADHLMHIFSVWINILIKRLRWVIMPITIFSLVLRML